MYNPFIVPLVQSGVSVIGANGLIAATLTGSPLTPGLNRST